jgi:hypothetical protein
MGDVHEDKKGVSQPKVIFVWEEVIEKPEGTIGGMQYRGTEYDETKPQGL